ncbi:hypothetical protein EI77_01729 [Prosthecobacter fusiformis]|uniref:Uncharacterized protein n=1 Tax=Prosthecobacter fusiformis TaxID=48464 RepID=A0A4R7S4C1_9BACT|nr:hypothetical protein EI77_01729 [Prosthecobacter fusiformis]
MLLTRRLSTSIRPNNFGISSREISSLPSRSSFLNHAGGEAGTPACLGVVAGTVCADTGIIEVPRTERRKREWFAVMVTKVVPRTGERWTKEWKNRIL